MTWTGQTIFRRAGRADIAAIMEIERQPGYDRLVARFSEAEHLANLAGPGYIYLVHDDADGVPVAFAALTGLGLAGGQVRINRFIVKHRGQGIGRRFLDAILMAIFSGATENLTLRVLPDNHAALSLYRSTGFRVDTLLERAGRRPDGQVVDLIVMSLSREDWDKRQG